MTEQHAPTTFKRRLVLIAVSDYDEGTPTQQAAFRTGISAQVAVVEDWWAGTHLEDQRRFTPSHPPKPLQSVHDLRAFLIDENLLDAHDDEALVIYITGHGLNPGTRQHFLRLPDSYEDRPLGTAFPTAELIVTALDSPAKHVLVMVDSCFSGRLEDELKENLKALAAERRALASLVVLTAGNDTSRPRLKAFTSALAAIRAHCEDETNGYARSHLSWEDWDTILKAVWDRTTMADIHRIWPTSRVSWQHAAQELSPCLPNPGYTDTTILEDARSQVGWTRTDLDDYWISRASGQMSATDAGWYFTGRIPLIKRMAAFLNSDDGVLIVTGQAGSGKSALLARLVTLSDPRFCADESYRPVLETIPEELHVPQGAVDAAVLARNTDPHELSAALYEAVTGRPAPTHQDVIQLLRNHSRNTALHRKKPLTLVIDGIDEARNPRRIITDVLRPLADLRLGSMPAVRLILGIRSSPKTGHETRHDEPGPPGLVDLLQRATHAGPPIRTDDSTAVDDIAAYTASLLRAEPAAGSNLLQRDDESLASAAAAVAREVAPSFLDARLAARQLHSRTLLPRPSDAHWRRQLRQGTHELLRQDLHDVAQHTGQRVDSLLAVLRATAFAQGSGLPWADIWPAAVRALDPALEADPHNQIRLVRDSRLTGYLTTTVEDGRTVYRPIHERISETLRTSPHTLQEGEEHLAAHSDTAQVHRQLATAFTVLLKDAVDRPPHPYLRRHLVAHAAAGKVLNDAHIPASFLPWESRGNVRGSLGLPVSATPQRKTLAAWSRIEHFLADAPPRARADSLALAQSTGDGTPNIPTITQGPHLAPRWNRLRLPANVLAGATSDIYQLIAFTTADNATVLAAGHADGTVTMWDPHTGTPFGLPITGLGPYARAMTVVANGPKRDPLFAVGTDTGLWLCDPQTGQAIPLFSSRVRAIAAFTGADHCTLLAVASGHETYILDPLTGELLAHHGDAAHEAARRRRPLTNALAAVDLPDGRTLLAVGREDHYVQLLETPTLKPAGQLHGQGRGVAAMIAYTTDHGEPRLVTASRSTKAVRIWDPVTGTEHKTAPIKEAVASMAVFRDTTNLWGRWGRPLLVTASSREEENHLRLWDLDTGELVHEIPTEHTKRVRGLAVFDGPGDTPVIASGSFDRTIRLWNLTTAQPLKQQRIPAATHLVLRPSTAGPPDLIAAGRDGEIDLRSAHTGTRLDPLGFEDDAKKEVTALAVPDAWPGTAPTAVGYIDGALRLLTPQGSWHTLCEANGYLHSRVRALAIIPNAEPQQTLLAAGFSNSWVGYWHLDHTVHQQRPARHDADGPVRALAALPGTDGPLLAVATRAVRLLHPGHASHARLPERIGSVRALASFTTPEDAHPLLVTGGTDGAVRLWHPAAPRKEVYPPLQGHRGAISAITSLHHPTMQTPLLVTAGSDDTSIRLWDHQTGEEVLRLVTAAPVTALTVLPPTAQLGHDPVIVFGGPRGLAAVAVRL